MIANETTESNYSVFSYKVKFNLGEHPGVFFTQVLLLLLGNFLSWVLHACKNSLPEHRLNINVFLNIRVVKILTVSIIILVSQDDFELKKCGFRLKILYQYIFLVYPKHVEECGFPSTSSPVQSCQIHSHHLCLHDIPFVPFHFYF